MAVGIGQADEIANAVIAIGVGVVCRVWTVRLYDTLQLVCCIVVILHEIPSLIGDTDQVARTIVAVRRCGRVGIDGFDQSPAGIELKLRGMTVAVSDRDTIPSRVIGVAGIALYARSGREPARRIVAIYVVV